MSVGSFSDLKQTSGPVERCPAHGKDLEQDDL